MTRRMCRKRLSTANALVENQNHQTLPTSTGFLLSIFKRRSSAFIKLPLSDGRACSLDQESNVPTQQLDRVDRERVPAHLHVLVGGHRAPQDSKIVHYKCRGRAQNHYLQVLLRSPTYRQPVLYQPEPEN